MQAKTQARLDAKAAAKAAKEDEKAEKAAAAAEAEGGDETKVEQVRSSGIWKSMHLLQPKDYIVGGERIVWEEVLYATHLRTHTQDAPVRTRNRFLRVQPAIKNLFSGPRLLGIFTRCVVSFSRAENVENVSMKIGFHVTFLVSAPAHGMDVHTQNLSSRRAGLAIYT
jgi:hypothetical protein